MQPMRRAKSVMGWRMGGATLAMGLGCWAIAADPSPDAKPAAVDAEQYADFIENEVLDIQDLAEGAEIQRRLFNRITPPGISLFQPMAPGVVPFVSENFDDLFLDGLFGEDKNSVVVYPLSLALDPKTRETLVRNADGDLIAAIPAEKPSLEWPEDADPARVTLRLDLLPAEDVEPYLYAEDRIGGSNVKTATARKATRRGLSANEFGICNIQKLTNGDMRLTVTNGASVAELYAYAVLHTSSVEVTTCTNEQLQVVTRTNILWHPVSPSFNGIQSAWECRTTNLLLTNGVGVWEDATISSSARVRFYAAANRVDADEDGLTDGEEIFLHRTDPDIADTDGDDMPDGWEVEHNLNARSGLDTTLAGWWRLDDGVGTNAVNSAQSGYSGELRGFSGATNSGWVEDGVLGGALCFDGRDDWIRIAQETAMLTGGPFTASAWVKLDGSCTSDWPEVVSDYQASTWNGYCMGFDPDQAPYATVGAAGWIQDANGAAEDWVWLLLEFDGAQMRLYRNGERIGDSAASFIRATNGYFSIGNGQDPSFSEHWKGLIDDVRLYRKAMGANGIASMYDAFDDLDGDGLSNHLESRYGANPRAVDSDADGLDDPEEIRVYGTNPMWADSDLDGMTDGWEVENGFDPHNQDGGGDADGDGLSNAEEAHAGTDPRMADTDGDGIGDSEDHTTGNCSLGGKVLNTSLPAHWQLCGNGNTGYPVPIATIKAHPTGFVGNVEAITNIVLSGWVDDCFKINGHEYVWTMSNKAFGENITASVSDRISGQFTVELYDYITNASYNLVMMTKQSNRTNVGATCVYRYRIALAVDLSEEQDWECWSSNGTYNAGPHLTTDSYTDGRVTWSLETIAGSPASISNNGVVSFGKGGGRYRIRASAAELGTCYDTMSLVVPKVDIRQATTNVCQNCGCDVTLEVTDDSYSPGGYVWSSSPAGISGRGSSITFDPATLPPGAYTVYAQSAAHPECLDICTVNVLNVEIENVAPRDTDDIQVQYFTNSAGTFTYTAIPLEIYYTISPTNGWTPDSVELHMKNPAGNIIRTITLPTTVGQQQTTWDGKDDGGDYVANGSNYVVEIAATIGSTTCTATNGLTVFEIRQGNCLYRDIYGGSAEHAAILYDYIGGNRLTDIQDNNKYVVAEHEGDGGDTTTHNYGGWNTWIDVDGAYCPAGLSRANRKAILENCSALIQATISYCLVNVLIWQGDDWDGTLADIAQLRCDGFVEAAYEALPAQLYGGGTWWNIMTAGSGSPINWTPLYRHNNNTPTSTAQTPERQRHTADGSGTANVKDSLYKP